MPLPSRQVEILRYLGKNGTATAGNVARELGISRRPALAALKLLAGNRLVSVDHSTWPASWSLTEIGRAVLDAEPEREQ